MIVLLLVLNFVISSFNAWSVGRSWPDAKAVGGWPRFMAWMVAIMSACGFTWTYTILLGLAANALGYLPMKYLNGMLSLGYLAIIIPLLFSGLALTIDSWSYFWRRRTFGSGAVAGWNTFAQVYNTYEAISAIPEALGAVGGMFSDSDGDSDANGFFVKLVVILVACATVGGILTTFAIVRVTARGSARRIRARIGTLGARAA